MITFDEFKNLLTESEKDTLDEAIGNLAGIPKVFLQNITKTYKSANGGWISWRKFRN